MPPAVSEREPKQASKHATARFRVLKPFGPWTNKDLSIGGGPNVFDRAEFVRLHPLPAAKDIHGNPQPQLIDPETYHDDLIDRGLALKCIVVDMTAELTETPLGPSNGKGKTNAIRESTEKMLADLKLRESIQRGERNPNANKPATPDRIAAMAKAGAQVGA